MRIRRSLTKLFTTIIIFTLTFSSTGVYSLAASGDTTVYVTKTGKCYHTANCSSLSKSKIETTLESASSKYSACSKCKPPVLDSSSSTTDTKTTTKSSTKSNTTKSTTKSTSSKTTKSTSKASTEVAADNTSKNDTTEQMVWIPTKGGTKYHKKSSCSNMDNPSQVSLDDAKSQGFTACKKCYK